MLRLLIIAHEPLASALKAVAAHIDPEASASIGVCDVQAGHSTDEVMAIAIRALDGLGAGDVLILTDVFGATPCNVARGLGERMGTRVVSGVNVPALWRAIDHLRDPLDKVAELVVAGGQQGVMHVSFSSPQHQAIKGSSNDSQHDHNQQ